MPFSNNFNVILTTTWLLFGNIELSGKYMIYFWKSTLIFRALYSCRNKLYALSVHYKRNCEYYKSLLLSNILLCLFLQNSIVRYFSSWISLLCDLESWQLTWISTLSFTSLFEYFQGISIRHWINIYRESCRFYEIKYKTIFLFWKLLMY